jgi:hypothetical protein
MNSVCDRRRNSRFGPGILVALAGFGPVAWGQGVQVPPGSNAVQVSAFGAVPDDGIDDLTAFQAALNATVGTNRLLYVPDGVYDLSGRLNWGGIGTGNGIIFQGQSESGTILRLVDNAPGFDGAGGSDRVFFDVYEGNTANAFRNYLRDVTIDVGNGNPGAIGLQFQSNNTGRIENVTVRSIGPGRRGKVGFDVAFEFPGPFLAKNLTIEGFDTGMRGAPQEYSLTIDGLALRHQNVLGIYVWRLPLQIRNLTSVNAVPVLSMDDNPGAWGHVVIDGGALTGGLATTDALINEQGAGVLTVRNVTTAGYRFAINDLSFGSSNARTVPDGLVGQYTTDSPFSLNPSPTPMLDVRGQDTPALPQIPIGQWVSVKAFGAVEDDNLDDTAAIRAALLSGSPVV